MQAARGSARERAGRSGAGAVGRSPNSPMSRKGILVRTLAIKEKSAATVPVRTRASSGKTRLLINSNQHSALSNQHSALSHSVFRHETLLYSECFIDRKSAGETSMGPPAGFMTEC